jgi:uncharacterized damage-inducible protein DinB
MFARGAKLGEASGYPSPDEVLAAWNEVKTMLSAAMEGTTEEAMAAAGPEKIPSLDGKMSGMVGFMAYHETYHVGQACYLRSYLGHGQVLG